MRRIFFVLLIFMLFVGGCGTPTPTSTQIDQPEPQIDQIKEDKYTLVVKTIKETDWSKATDSDWQTIRELLFEIDDYKDEHILSSYISSLKYYIDGNERMALEFIDIDKNYNGVLGKEVNILRETLNNTETGKSIAESKKWLEEYENSQKDKPQEPRIGMTEEEVLKSSWGKPNKVNRTTTANTVYEQWVYGSNRYVYLDNGIVTAIQDSK